MAAVAPTNNNYLTVTDPRTNTTITIPIDAKSGTIPGTAFTQFKITPTCPPPEAPEDKVPIRLYDPGFKNTTVCRSKVSQIDAANGKLYYRGYDIEELAEKSNYMEVTYLLIYGELPSKEQLDHFVKAVMTHTYIHAELERQMLTFRYDAHPHGMLIATIAALSTFHPEANPALHGVDMYMKPKAGPGKELSAEDQQRDKSAEATRNRAVFRMLGKVSTIAANVYRHRQGRSYNHPMPHCLNYTENVLYMMDKLDEPDFQPDPRLVKILDTMFILLAEHGSNCSTVFMRHLTSSGVDPYTALSGSAGALFGERKSAAVIDMLKQIGKPEKIQLFLSMVKRKDTDASALYVSTTMGGANKKKSQSNRPLRLMGFGHRIYKNGDPRVKIAKKLAFELFDLMGKDPLVDLAMKLEEAVLGDEWFTKRGLFTNIDFWTAIIFHTMQFPPDMFPVLTTVPRVAGLVANCLESLDDPEYKIFRPRQIYIGETHRSYAPTTGRRTTQVAPALEAQYVRSDPIAARRRNVADPTTLAEIDDLISRTQRSLEDLNVKLGGLEGSPLEEEGGTKIKDRLSTWVASRLFGNPTGVGNAIHLTERLQQTQAELQRLQLRQLEMKQVEEEEARKASKASGSPNRSPDLSSGNRSPRPIMTTTDRPASAEKRR
ncbi:citrate synthase-like protein [Phlyctochytrium arcticum]|nr:citrate synthase-like protein [Phlyctochytrium arcticum]